MPSRPEGAPVIHAAEPPAAAPVRAVGGRAQPSPDWLIRLRWILAAGLLAILLATEYGLGIHLSLPRHFVVIGLIALSNCCLTTWGKRCALPRQALYSTVMTADVVLLTVILFWTGGVQNPFCSFYLVPIAIAAMTLQGGAMWLPILVSLGGFVLTFFYHEPVHMPHTHGQNLSFDLHLQGMVVANVLTGACLIYFVARLTRDLRASREKLAASRELAARNERFASLATLAAGVAHELNSPLGTIAVISKELEHAARRHQAPAEILSDAQLLRREIERCREILERLNDSSTRGVGDAPQLLSAAQVLEDLRQKLAPEIWRRIETQIPREDLEFFAPRAAVIQALAALVKNAHDASGEGQRIRLEMARSRDEVEFTVTDQGAGVPKDLQARVTEPFFTTKQPGQGMGLGLFLVRTLAERLGGRFSLLCQPGSGTRAVFSLPLPSPSEASQNKQP